MDGPVTFFRGPAQVLSDPWRSPSQFSRSFCVLSPANIFFSLRFSSSMAFDWPIRDASMPPYFARHLQNDAFPLSDCRQSPAGQWHHAMLAAQLSHRHAAFSPSQDHDDQFIGACAAPSGATVPASSIYLLVFILNLLLQLAEKIPLLQPLPFGGDYPLDDQTNLPDEGHPRPETVQTLPKFVAKSSKSRKDRSAFFGITDMLSPDRRNIQPSRPGWRSVCRI